MCRPRRGGVAPSNRRKRLKRAAAERRKAAQASALAAAASDAPGASDMIRRALREGRGNLECGLEVRKAGRVVEVIPVPDSVLRGGDAARREWVRKTMDEVAARSRDDED